LSSDSFMILDGTAIENGPKPLAAENDCIAA
jgi:hypothetical protein